MASTQIITDLSTARDTAISAVATAASIAAAGPIQDIPGNLDLAVIKAKELRSLLLLIDQDIAASDDSAIQTILTDVLASLD